MLIDQKDAFGKTSHHYFTGNDLFKHIEAYVKEHEIDLLVVFRGALLIYRSNNGRSSVQPKGDNAVITQNITSFMGKYET